MSPARLGRGAVVALAVLGAACSDTEAKERASITEQVGAVPEGLVPPELAGLSVTPETVEGLQAARRAYVDQVSLFGLREGEQLKATLQISRFNAAADATSPKFRGTLVNRIGGSSPRRFRMGTTDVYFTTATSQTLALWFRDDYLFIMAARDDFARPRTLVRQALEIRP